MTGDPQHKRLFAAVELPEGIRAALEALQRKAPGIRRSSLAGAHLTLRFLGDVPLRDLPAVQKALRTVRAEPFSLRMQGLGLFARSGRGVFWAGLEESPALLDLKRQVDAALAAGAGISPDARRFSPHVTLSRLKTPPSPALRAFAAEHASESAGSFAVERFVLFGSLLTPGGAVHTPEEIYPLGVRDRAPAAVTR